MLGRPGYVFYSSVFAAVLNSMLNRALIPVYGIVGDATTDVVAAAMNVVRYCVLRATFG